MPKFMVVPLAPGTKFGSLTVVSRAGSDRHGIALWTCRCACGASVEARGGHLRAGRTMNCGRGCPASAGVRATGWRRTVVAPPAAKPAAACEHGTGDRGTAPRCVWCAEPALRGTARCRARAGPRFVTTAPDAPQLRADCGRGVG